MEALMISIIALTAIVYPGLLISTIAETPIMSAIRLRYRYWYCYWRYLSVTISVSIWAITFFMQNIPILSLILLFIYLFIYFFCKLPTTLNAHAAAGFED
jgi:hypothetical protein